MIDKSHIGAVVSNHTQEVEAGRLRFFAKATGQHDPRYSDAEAARAAGYKHLPVPPTFLFCLDMEAGGSSSMLSRLKIDLGKILHGEQSFTYHQMAYVGDRLTFESKIVDIYDKKGGALEFVVRETRVTNAAGDLVAELRNSLVVRN
ncbi:MaoC family dehydratase N-terminal domain-containing protein [Pseudomonas sp. UL073]|uniref:MaoC family dehydratase N-terminal domain-containing protein n=1 Tax=Zestomonas insulae TaxID=2809017 RepID=A0ABS2IHS0_9GAMM|nr:MaoC family dehydratase N-terminal domain-containing protein [Pseudomonas insulae]MBM7061874.1 MaoC family dehydratase N-terminal domain-containing protein [Pseudomonas insulae]